MTFEQSELQTQNGLHRLIRHCEEPQATRQSRTSASRSGLLRFVRNDVNENTFGEEMKRDAIILAKLCGRDDKHIFAKTEKLGVEI